uniref:Uncharacterized protein n=2 Tax=viral metagenome TaxID=1070528 RepID=A0A6H1ZIV7_9ZZZZ
MRLLRKIKAFADVELEFENQLGVDIEQVFTVAGTEYTLNHNLRRTPKGWQCIDKDTYGVFSRVSWNNTVIVLKCNTAATTATIRIF